jgi:hypothetical protein
MLGYFKTALDVLSGEKSLEDGIKEGTVSYVTGNLGSELLNSGSEFMDSFGSNPLASPEMGNMGLENYDIGMDNVQADINGFTATPEANQIAMNDYNPIQNNMGTAPNMSHQQQLLDVTPDVSQGNFGTPQTPDWANSLNTSDPEKQMLTNGYEDTFTDGVRDQATNHQPNMGLINPPDTAQASASDDDTFLGLTKGQYAQTALNAGVGALANQQSTPPPTTQAMPITAGKQVTNTAINNGLGLISNDVLLQKLRQQGIA